MFISLMKSFAKKIRKFLLPSLLAISMGLSLLWYGRNATGAVRGEALSATDVFASSQVSQRWILLGEGFPKNLTFSVTFGESLPSSCLPEAQVSYRVLGTILSGPLSESPSNPRQYFAEVDLSSLATGKYQILSLFRSPCGSFNSEGVEFNISAPLYVAWTLDWEGYDVTQDNLEAMDVLAKNYNLPITHFFNPRIYVNGEISQSRQDYLTNWVKNRSEDAIGLHLHMFKDMVEAAGVTPHFEPAWGINSFHDEGYDVFTSSYAYEEITKILNWAKSTFASKGLPLPTMFRAGGWFADEGTLKALGDNGFVLDSSGRTRYQLGLNGSWGPWDLSSTAQPYHPNLSDQNSPASPNLSLWEFPNSGGDSWAFSTEGMFQRFWDNFGGTPLSEKRIVTYLSHPQWFDKEGPKMEALFAQIDRYLYEKDGGPVVYVTLEKALEIWSSK